MDARMAAVASVILGIDAIHRIQEIPSSATRIECLVYEAKTTFSSGSNHLDSSRTTRDFQDAIGQAGWHLEACRYGNLTITDAQLAGG
jgi:hypothetical protein